MARKADPDFAVDSDRGSGTTAAKQAQVMGVDVFTERAATRAGLRDLDARMEAMAGLTRAQRDRERITPRAQVAELGHPVMLGTLLEEGQVRAPLSSRQKKARSKTRLAVQGDLPDTQYLAQRDLMSSDERFVALGDALSDHAGDVGELSASQAAQVRRVDRSIAAYERGNDRGHVLYANVEMPVAVNAANLEAFVARRLPVGTVVAFDRYTGATHQLHEATARAGGLRLRGRRGAGLRDRHPPRCLPGAQRQHGRHRSPAAARDGFPGRGQPPGRLHRAGRRQRDAHRDPAARRHPRTSHASTRERQDEMTKDRRGREVFSVDPAILGGGARYRTVAPAEPGEQEDEGDRAKQDLSSNSAGPRGGKRAARPR